MLTAVAVVALAASAPILTLIIAVFVIAFRSQRLNADDQAHSRQVLDGLIQLARVVVLGRRGAH